MKLIPALGSREMQDAIRSYHVRRLVDILLQITDPAFFRLVALFLKSQHRYTTPGFTQGLQGLREYHQEQLDAEGSFIIPSYFEELIQALIDLYKQDQRLIDFQRGAIVEVFASRLVCSRCKSNECFGNHRFVDSQYRYESDQVDVAVLSELRQQIEGYACKMNANGIQSVDCTNLTALATHANMLEYDVHIGVVCFDNTHAIRQRLRRLPSTKSIQAYGLSNLQELRKSPF